MRTLSNVLFLSVGLISSAVNWNSKATDAAGYGFVFLLVCSIWLLVYGIVKDTSEIS